MYLTIDHGNSRTKTGVFTPDGTLIKTQPLPDQSLSTLKEYIASNSISHIIISTTGTRDWQLQDLNFNGLMFELNHETPLPIEIIYKTPETLGRDRIASACGAHHLYMDKNCLIVDAGTCITTDLVTSKGKFLGGNISPGIRMRLTAMHEKTARLPLVEPEFPEIPFGDSTQHAMQNGACLGAIMEIEGILSRAKDAYGDVSVVITGGDADLLATRLECQIFVEPELVIQGLFQILSFNVKNYS